jgi:hypothetical protein
VLSQSDITGTEAIKMKKEVLGFFGFKTPDVFRLVAMDN